MSDDLTTKHSLHTLHASVIVCTYNRSASLGHTLKALANQKLSPETRWELIVVDNNSQDDTREVVKRFVALSKVPLIRYVFEPTQGLSHARNRGIGESRGEILLFTDDDVRPEREWMHHILEGMARHQCDACGGYISPDWEVSPPAWLTAQFYGFLAVHPERVGTFQVTTMSEAPFGANMAFRRSTLEQFGHFNLTRGRKGTVLASGEDGELFERLLAGGAKVMFFGDAGVQHRIERFRVTKRYLRRWRFQSSRNIALSRGFPGARRVLGIPLYLYPQFVRACAKAVSAYFTQPPDEAFHREMIVWHFLGVMQGLLRVQKRFTPENQTEPPSDHEY